MFGHRPTSRSSVSLPARRPAPVTHAVEPLERRRLLAGDFAWTASFEGVPAPYAYDFSIAQAVTSDPNGNVITAGTFGGQVDFDPGAGVVTLNAGDFATAFVTKLDAAGQLAWARAFSSDAQSVAAASVATDAAGNVYVAGTASSWFGGTVDLDPGPGVAPLSLNSDYSAFVVKLDPDGNFVWARTFTPGSYPLAWFGVSAASVAVDGAGNVTLGGSFAGNIDLDPGAGETVVNSTGGADAFVVRLDTAGSVVWAKTFGGTGYDYASSVATDAAGNAYVNGVFNGTTDLDPSAAGVSSATSHGGFDAYVAKLSATGTLAWAKTFGGADNESARAVAVDPAGNVLVGGTFAGTADFDPGAGAVQLTSAGGDDAFVLRLTASGGLLRALRFGGTGSDSITGIDATRHDAVYLAGSFSDTVDFGGGGAAGAQMTSVGPTNGFIARLDAASDTVAWARATGAPETESANGVSADIRGNVYAAGSLANDVSEHARAWKLLDAPPAPLPVEHVDEIADLLPRLTDLAGTVLTGGQAAGIADLLSSADQHLAAGRTGTTLNKLRAVDHQLSAAMRSLKPRDPNYADSLAALESLRSALAELTDSLA